jgi:hypothetical protein
MIIGNGKRTIGEMSVDTRLLLQELLKAEIGATLTYDDLHKVIGRDVRSGGGYAALTSARRAAQRERIVFGTISKIGIKRLDALEITKNVAGRVHGISKRVRNAIRLQDCAEFDQLPQPAKTQFNTNLSQLQVLAHISSVPTTKKLENKIAELGKSIPLAKMLQEFK